MMLIAKMTQTEPPLDALAPFSDGEKGQETSSFSGLFSSLFSGSVKREEGAEMLPQTGMASLDNVSVENIDSVSGLIAQLTSPTGEQKETYPLLMESVESEVERPEASLLGGGMSDVSDKSLVNVVQPILESKNEFTSVERPTTEPMSIEAVPIESAVQIVEKGENLPPPIVNVDLVSNGLNQTQIQTPQKVEVFEQANDMAVLTVQEQIQMAATTQVVAQMSTQTAGDGRQASVPFNPSVASSVNVSNQTVSWGVQGGDAQASQGFGQQGQSFGQSNQNSSGSQPQQQAALAAQIQQDNRQLSLEQQAAVRVMESAVEKSDTKALLGGAEIASIMPLDRKGALPLGLQTLNLPAKTPQWSQAFGQRIVFMSNNSLQQAQITLNPQSLGQIQVTLQLDKDQKMHVNLVAQSGIARESMENALPKLREMMAEAGIDLASVDIREQKSFSEHASNHSNESEKQASNSNLLEGSSTEEILSNPIASTDNIVDYYA